MVYKSGSDDEVIDDYLVGNRCKGCTRKLKVERRHPPTDSDAARTNGIDKNPEGQCMAEVIYYFEHHRFPSADERRDFHKMITRGHSFPISERYYSDITSYLGPSTANRSPFDVLDHLRHDGAYNQLERELGSTANEPPDNPYPLSFPDFPLSHTSGINE